MITMRIVIFDPRLFRASYGGTSSRSVQWNNSLSSITGLYPIKKSLVLITKWAFRRWKSQLDLFLLLFRFYFLRQPAWPWPGSGCSLLSYVNSFKEKLIRYGSYQSFYLIWRSFLASFFMELRVFFLFAHVSYIARSPARGEDHYLNKAGRGLRCSVTNKVQSSHTR
jgi:hypothetical protein